MGNFAMEKIKNYFKFAFDFVGVASRAEFWIPFGIFMLIQIVFCGLAFLGTFFQVALIILVAVLAVPNLSIMVRRLHDTDRSALNLLWLLLPVVGLLIVLIFCMEKTKYFI